VANRNTNPEPHPLIQLLTIEGSNDAEDSMVLVGFIGHRGPQGELRLFADRQAQRYLDIPETDIIHAEEIPEDELGRMRIHVRRGVMVEQAFDTAAEDELKAAIIGPGMSVWQFLPENRIIAAGMFGMLPEESRGYEEQEEETTQ
jgi:hypothetical protein